MEYMRRAQPLGYLVAALTSFVFLGAASAQESVSAETVAAIQEELPIAVIVAAAASGGQRGQSGVKNRRDSVVEARFSIKDHAHY